MSDQLTVDVLKKAAPPALRGRIDQNFVDTINQASTDPEYCEIIKENALSYINVLREGKFQLDQYLNAVKYVCYKNMGDSNISAYVKTFPTKYQNFLTKKTEQKDIARYVTAFNQSKLVNLIFEQTAIPLHILNQTKKQDAINQLAYLMKNAKSEKVQQESANSLLTHLKTPDDSKLEIDVTIKEDKTINALKKTMRELVQQQVVGLESGTMTAQQIGHSTIIEAEFEEVDDD
jgi:hypothetical protein